MSQRRLSEREVLFVRKIWDVNYVCLKDKDSVLCGEDGWKGIVV